MKSKNKNLDSFESVGIFLLTCIVFVKIMMSLTSCKTLEQKCTERFPSEVTEVVREVTTTDSLYITEKLLEFIDTTECLPTRDRYFVYDTIVYRLPGETVYYEYECIDTIVQYRDQPKINYLTDELSAAQVEHKELKAKIKAGRKWFWAFLICAVLAALFFVLTIMRAAKD